MIELERKYYSNYSANRYSHTESNYLTILTPFQKQYFRKSRTQRQHSGQEVIPWPISEAVRHALKILRLDILSKYQDHNLSPSVRSLHSCNILIIMSEHAYVYSLYEDEFLWLTDQMDFNRGNTRGVLVAGLSDLLNLSRYYSEFSLYISNLDAGHVLFNMKHALCSHGINYRQYAEYNSGLILNNLPLDTSTSFVSFLLELQLPETLSTEAMPGPPDMAVAGGDIRGNKGFNELASTQFLEPLLLYYSNTTDWIMMEENGASAQLPPLDCNPGRNSAHTMVGNFNLDEDFDRFHSHSFFENIHRSLPLVSSNQFEYVLLIREGGYNTVLYRSNGERDVIQANYARIMYDDSRFFDLKTYHVVIVCYSETARLDNIGLRTHLIACGEFMQSVSLYAARLGYAFRPMKNHNDNYLKQILSLDEEAYEINYMGVLCNSPVEQISFHL